MELMRRLRRVSSRCLTSSNSSAWVGSPSGPVPVRVHSEKASAISSPAVRTFLTRFQSNEAA
ncbi:hypothetical protein AVDCRST_MAG82-897 [uncultured Rubrobacteraceae bacterium]|uniref:Uncharacterized protein n=1 Tax=uncultured Rubrobacteraceae bacterium TaxID=349277 RepID=A0A6J4PCS7_9ACTN|nr:hypothetical protein AVDCRST_MAG82-897 [uncultured Rubrobacteraceae bacterium]